MAIPDWLAVATWLVYPCVFVIGCWGVAWFPQVMAKFLPWPLFKEERGARERVAPSADDGIFSTLLRRQKIYLSEKEFKTIPKNRLSAFLVGRAAGRIEAPDSSENTILAEAADIIGIPVDDLNKETLVNIGDILEIVEPREKKIWTGKWLSQFDVIVNIFWIIGIIGVIYTLAPFLQVVAGPLMDWLADVAVFVFHLLSKLEPLWRLCVWLVCVYFAAISLCIPPNVAPWVVLTASGFSVGGYIYSLGNLSIVTADWQAGFCFLYLSLAMVPLAYKFDSGLLGFVTLFTIWQTFFVLVVYEAFQLLFPDQDFFGSEKQICLSSFVITVLLVILKWSVVTGDPPVSSDDRPGASDRMFGPFRVGLYVFGPTCFFGTFLSISAYWDGSTTFGYYVTTNVLYITSILTMFVFGTVIDFKSFRNTSIFFTIFWVFTRILDATLLFGENRYVIETFLVFVSIVLAAGYIRSHPEWAKDLIP